MQERAIHNTVRHHGFSTKATNVRFALDKVVLGEVFDGRDIGTRFRQNGTKTAFEQNGNGANFGTRGTGTLFGSSYFRFLLQIIIPAVFRIQFCIIQG